MSFEKRLRIRPEKKPNIKAPIEYNLSRYFPPSCSGREDKRKFIKGNRHGFINILHVAIESSVVFGTPCKMEEYFELVYHYSNEEGVLISHKLDKPLKCL